VSHKGTLGDAIAIAADVHRTQTDKAGEVYILHALAVMNIVAPDRDAMIVAVLHDVIEDAKDAQTRMKARWNIERLFDPYIAEALEAMTHRPDESYAEYIERVAGNYLARKVKIADLTHNMDPRRIPAYQIVDKDFKRWDKYRRALIRLEREG
jgi:(p)ppGpp synthase/HD superfamily hydrolase